MVKPSAWDSTKAFEHELQSDCTSCVGETQVTSDGAGRQNSVTLMLLFLSHCSPRLNCRSVSTGTGHASDGDGFCVRTSKYQLGFAPTGFFVLRPILFGWPCYIICYLEKKIKSFLIIVVRKVSTNCSVIFDGFVINILLQNTHLL